MPLKIHGRKAIIFQSFNKLPDIVLAEYWADEFEDKDKKAKAKLWTTECWQKRIFKNNMR